MGDFVKSLRSSFTGCILKVTLHTGLHSQRRGAGGAGLGVEGLEFRVSNFSLHGAGAELVLQLPLAEALNPDS